MRILKMGGLVLAVLFAPAPVQADVIYNFTQVGPALGPTGNTHAAAPNSVVLSANITVTDAAAARGFDFSIQKALFDLGPVRASIAGLLGLDIVIRTGAFTPVTVSLADYLMPRRSSSGIGGTVDLKAAAGGLPVGTFYYNTQSIDFRVTSSGNSIFTASINADGDLPCFFGPCTVFGVVTRAVAVPEPAALGLFILGVTAMTALRRRERAVRGEATIHPRGR